MYYRCLGYTCFGHLPFIGDRRFAQANPPYWYMDNLTMYFFSFICCLCFKKSISFVLF
ncbi:hypothetical protein Hanom_Chr10g00947001 [Helianthus anomalus]